MAEPPRPPSAKYPSYLVPYSPGSFEELEISEYQQSIVPVVVRTRDAAVCLGTAFSIGWGVFLTAGHVAEAIAEEQQMKRESEVSLLYYGDNFRNWSKEYAIGLPVLRAVAARHHDVGVIQVPAHTVSQEGTPLLFRRFTLAPRVPQPGSWTRAYGYNRMSLKVEPITTDEYRVQVLPNFTRTQGDVMEVFPHGQGRMKPFPSAHVDARYDPGMSGGPVFSRDGAVIGTISTGLTDDSGERPFVSYMSLLAPAFGLPVLHEVDERGGLGMSSILELCQTPWKIFLYDRRAANRLHVETPAIAGAPMEYSYRRHDGHPPYWQALLDAPDAHPYDS